MLLIHSIEISVFICQHRLGTGQFVNQLKNILLVYLKIFLGIKEPYN